MASIDASKPNLRGALTVKVHRCINLQNQRTFGKMNPYVKLNCDGAEKFKSAVLTDAHQNPVFEQVFLFNLNGGEEQLHLKVFDDCIGSDDCIGRVDLFLMQVLANGGGEKSYPLADPKDMRKNTGEMYLSLSFNGTGGPAIATELAPIMGHFHFQHNATGLLVHVAHDMPHLAPGGSNDSTHAFEWQGPYLRYVPTSQYLHAVPATGVVAMRAGIAEEAKWKWTGLGLQHMSSGMLLHPAGEALVAGTKIVLAAGVTPASGFTLLKCDGSATPHAVVVAAAPAVMQQTTTVTTAPAVAVVAPHGGAPVAMPQQLTISNHPHPLHHRAHIYQGTYNCDMCGKPGHGDVYHCDPCQYDAHPACVQSRR